MRRLLVGVVILAANERLTTEIQTLGKSSCFGGVLEFSVCVTGLFFIYSSKKPPKFKLFTKMSMHHGHGTGGMNMGMNGSTTPGMDMDMDPHGGMMGMDPHMHMNHTDTGHGMQVSILRSKTYFLLAIDLLYKMRTILSDIKFKVGDF
ncbi:hypothetical protein FSP39_015538 [Pinctada imbricata]|uniref:Uncharacterized protein n=1 Tax=Pinctada imbricata TaxID=66713 RepID=A0AA88XMJ2_PINIB|nr:hypothetical protein FSP39_015538 [Pinctada imbricata]